MPKGLDDHPVQPTHFPDKKTIAQRTDGLPPLVRWGLKNIYVYYKYTYVFFPPWALVKVISVVSFLDTPVQIQPNLTIIHRSNIPHTFVPPHHVPHFSKCHTLPLHLLPQLPFFEIVFIHWWLARIYHLLNKNSLPNEISFVHNCNNTYKLPIMNHAACLYLISFSP